MFYVLESVYKEELVAKVGTKEFWLKLLDMSESGKAVRVKSINDLNKFDTTKPYVRLQPDYDKVCVNVVIA